MLLSQMTLLILGLTLGSFIGACAYRIPRRISVVAVPSSCPNCGRGLDWFELVPLGSFMIQLGRCRSCKMKIPWRYPLIELVVATGMLILFSRSGATGEFILKAAVFLLMTLISLIDWDFQLIPNRVLVVGGIFGIALKGLVNLPALPESIVSAFLSFGVIFSLRFLANLLLRRDSLGMGDVKLAFLLGLFLGFRLFLVAFWAASILGAIYGLTRRKSHRSDPLPFGSFLALTSILAFTFDEESLRVLSLWS